MEKQKKIVKIRLRNRMDDEFIANSLNTYIKKDINKLFSEGCNLKYLVLIDQR